ncbi:NADH-quinone oxidoreductase subunit A [Marinobacter salicampi]|uniref:NADH-quinone oxidoreductase subunit A n=1 Tax=Marinobacter salicampi TaxID=435907 RepID=UPI001408D853|nr:NADH-quinone oxidoreductase subunit A [Marinobacter salicampi]
MELTELLTLLIIGLLTFAVGLWLSGRPITKPQYRAAPPWPQRAPFLGGGSPENHAWNRFHARYYPMTLLLIAFEMEMMFMYPWAVVYVAEGMKALVEMGMFLAILSVGIIYGWREGAFKWQ